MIKRSWTEINIAQLKQNYIECKKYLSDSEQIMAIIKADAYGHGSIQVGKALSDLGVKLFGVANLQEAIELRDAGISGDILILGYTSCDYSKLLIDYDLTQTLVSEEHAKSFEDAGYRIKCQFAIDTGMNRIGLDADDPDTCVSIIRYYKDVFQLTGIFSHLCVADSLSDIDKSFTCRQINLFNDIVHKVTDLNLQYTHILNSAGFIGKFYTNTIHSPHICNVIRLGIILYGVSPSSSIPLPSPMLPILSWKAEVSMIKDLHVGESIGYGRTYYADKDMKVATITVGYADGYNRLLSNKGYVIVNGQKARILGNICMDQSIIDVSGINNISMGSEIMLLTSGENRMYNVEKMASDSVTIPYEVLCGISKRVIKVYNNSDEKNQ